MSGKPEQKFASKGMGERPCLMIFAQRRGDRLWGALYEVSLTFGEVCDELKRGEAIARATKRHLRKRGVPLVPLILKVANVGERWDPDTDQSVSAEFFKGNFHLVIPAVNLFPSNNLPPQLRIDGVDFVATEGAAQ